MRRMPNGLVLSSRCYGATLSARLQESLAQQERMLTLGFDELSAGLVMVAAGQALHVDSGQLSEHTCWASPETFGKLDTLSALTPPLPLPRCMLDGPVSCICRLRMLKEAVLCTFRRPQAHSRS